MDRFETRDGCTVVRGVVPLDEVARLLHRAPSGAVLDASLAEQLQATLVFGRPEDLETLRKTAPPRRLPEGVEALSPAARAWLAQGERGLSSEAMFQHLTGFDANRKRSLSHTAYPHDAADFRRCRLLLEQVPELTPRLGEMASLSREWAQLVKQWDCLCATLDAEAPNWRNGQGSGRLTSSLLREILDEAPSTSTPRMKP